MEPSWRLLERLCRARSHGSARLALLIVAAHPDDEVIGAGALLGRAVTSHVLHVTQGAPRDSRFIPLGLGLTREGYAHARREEALRALALAGIAPQRAACLEIGDQEASFVLPVLAQQLATRFAELRPDLILVQPYEGGHPDHDAVAFAVHAARGLLRQRQLAAPPLAEMTSYFGRGGARVVAEFLPNATPITTLELSAAEQARKRAMFECFATQRAVLEGFGVERERFRPAPRYDFGRAPHDGALFYESQNWPIDGTEWRRLAKEAARELRLGEGPWA